MRILAMHDVIDHHGHCYPQATCIARFDLRAAAFSLSRALRGLLGRQEIPTDAPRLADLIAEARAVRDLLEAAMLDRGDYRELIGSIGPAHASLNSAVRAMIGAYVREAVAA